jgi:hypothetical protein
MTLCEKHTGIPVEVLRKAKQDGCTCFSYARVDLEKFLRWYFKPKDGELLLPPTPNNVPIGKSTGGARGELDQWRAGRERIKFLRESKKVVLKEEVKSDGQEAMAVLFETLERVFCAELPPALVGLRELEIYNRCRAEIDTLKDVLREKISKLAIQDGEADDAEESGEDESLSSDESDDK